MNECMNVNAWMHECMNNEWMGYWAWKVEWMNDPIGKQINQRTFVCGYKRRTLLINGRVHTSKMNEWMNEWMDNEWMNEWMNEWIMNKWLIRKNKWRNDRLIEWWNDNWMNSWPNKWMTERNKWITELIKEWMNVWMNEWWMNESTKSLYNKTISTKGMGYIPKEQKTKLKKLSMLIYFYILKGNSNVAEEMCTRYNLNAVLNVVTTCIRIHVHTRLNAHITITLERNHKMQLQNDNPMWNAPIAADYDRNEINTDII